MKTYEEEDLCGHDKAHKLVNQADVKHCVSKQPSNNFTDLVPLWTLISLSSHFQCSISLSLFFA